MAFPTWPSDQAFFQYVKNRYKGKVWRIERSTHRNPEDATLVVRVEFHIPVADADELEVFRRINRVLEVIVEGTDGDSV